MYSGESGEEFANYKQHSENEMQLKFTSGIVNIIVLDTPQPFPSSKNFHVTTKEVKDLTEMITIQLPVNEDEFKGLSYEQIAKKSKCHYRSNNSTSWNPLESECRSD